MRGPVQIIIKGPPGSGKGTACYAIRQGLTEIGFIVEDSVMEDSETVTIKATHKDFIMEEANGTT
jgi:adenylate kinase family enzyme